jgi:hypothetical protein
VRRLALVLIVAAIAAPAACAEGDRECYPTDWRACRCDAAEGYQQCDAAGDGYGACDCSGAIPGLTTSAASSGGGGSGGGGSEKLPFMSPCVLDEDCESGLCFNFNAKGPLCTIPCSPETVCPPPSPGCSLMGVCKAP